MTMTCRRCGAELERPATGRPPTYCGVGCRRAAEHEIRRLTRHLERYEKDAADQRIRVAVIRAKYPDEREEWVLQQISEPQARLTALETEIDAAEARLSALLADPQVTP